MENTKTEAEQIQKAATEISTRKIETVQSVEVKSDSLLILFMMGNRRRYSKRSIKRQNHNAFTRLTAKGINKTVYITPEMGDSLILIMYAEYLGSIQPNTDLLVVTMETKFMKFVSAAI